MSQKPVSYITVGHSMVSISLDGNGLRLAFAEVQVPEDKIPSRPTLQPAEAYDAQGREVRFDVIPPRTYGRFI